MSMEIALKLENVVYSHENGKALNECTINLRKECITVVLGPNGAGKSILLKLCHGLLQPTSGKITPTDASDESAMVFPKPVLLRRSVLENLAFVLEQANVKKEERENIATQALNEFSMEEFADRPARRLSSGEQQKLSLIRALLMKPDILYLDEPTANLDPNATSTLEQMIAKASNNDVTIIMATHDLMQAKRIAEQIIYIEDGHIVEVSTAADFFESPKDERAKRFIAGKL